MLDLEFNQLQTIELKWFENLRNLKTLNLKYNRISSIAGNAFANLFHLERLTLARNALKHFSSNLISNMKQIQILDMSEQNAGFTRIDSYSLGHDSNADNERYSVDLSKNRIEYLDKRVFCTRQNQGLRLSSINLNENPLQSIDPCIFVNLKRESNQTKTRVHLDIGLRCDCRVQFIASLVQLEGKCTTDKGTRVPMTFYSCNNQNQVENMCNDIIDDYSCAMAAAPSATTTLAESKLVAATEPTLTGKQQKPNVPSETLAIEEQTVLTTTIPIPAQPVKSQATCSMSCLDIFFLQFALVCFHKYFS
jgi:hypothetical protein